MPSFRDSVTLDHPPDAVWPLVSDTDPLNRALGLPPVAFEQEDDLTRIATASMGELTLRWIEHPFEWVAPVWFSIERTVLEGPLAAYRAGVRLHPEGDGTRVEVTVNVQPRTPEDEPVATAMVGPDLVAGFLDVCRHFEQYLDRAETEAYPIPRETPDVNEALLEERVRALDGVLDEQLVDLLGSFIREGTDEEVADVRPFELADDRGLERMEVLKAFLHATRAGLFDMTWELLCPNCRVAKEETTTLAQIRGAAHCEFCDITFGPFFDRNVEVRFAVNPNIRKAARVIYCVGGPGNTRHIRAQLRLPPETTREERIALPEGAHRLRVPRAGAPVQLSVESEAELEEKVAVTVSRKGIRVSTPSVVANDELSWRFRNEGTSEELLMLEDRRWHTGGASAAVVTSLQPFRDLFSSEALAPGYTLAIKNLAFCFTDLKDSTQMYDELGDGPAFAVVRDHFEVLKEVVESENGTIVKTIGDAIMGCFSSDLACVRACVKMQEAIRRFNAEEDASIGLKIGAHAGPCVTMNANDVLDYFGSTVNIAARVEGESRGGDIVLTARLAEEPAIREFLEKTGLKRTAYESRLKGFTETIDLIRLEVD